MDSGPVATYQVHEYLRPKVRFLLRRWTLYFFLLLYWVITCYAFV